MGSFAVSCPQVSASGPCIRVLRLMEKLVPQSTRRHRDFTEGMAVGVTPRSGPGGGRGAALVLGETLPLAWRAEFYRVSLGLIWKLFGETREEGYVGVDCGSPSALQVLVGVLAAAETVRGSQASGSGLLLTQAPGDSHGRGWCSDIPACQKEVMVFWVPLLSRISP